MYSFQENEKHKLPKSQTKKEPRPETDRCSDQRFPEHHQTQIFLVHPHHLIQPQFFFPLLNEEAVRIEQENHRESSSKSCHPLHYCADGRSASYLFQSVIHADGAEGVKEHNGQNTGKKIRRIGLMVFLKVHKSKLWIKQLIHAPHLLSPGLSAQLISSGTSLRLSDSPCRSDDTPARRG